MKLDFILRISCGVWTILIAIMKVEGIFVIFLIPIAGLLAKKSTAASSGKWWSIATGPHKSNVVSTDTKGVPIMDNSRLWPLNKRQRKLVTSNPGTLAAVSMAVKMAVAECKFQFRDRKWNCPTTKNGIGETSLFGKILKIGCRETSFIYSITSAAVTHSIARACSEGSIETCTCDYRHRGPTGDDWEWGGCSDNADFGHRFSRKFVDAEEKGQDLRCQVNVHNNQAGRMTVSQEMRKECKCHGMSGSCTIKTCWMRLPTFQTVGKHLKERFDGSSKVAMKNDGNHGNRAGGNTYRRSREYKSVDNFQPYNSNHKKPSQRDLVYYENSPDFCGRSKKFGTSGTQGRECNSTSLGVDGCDLMCCGRGYDSSELRVKERCSCTFHWCCHVKCQECTTYKSIHRCR